MTPSLYPPPTHRNDRPAGGWRDRPGPHRFGRHHDGKWARFRSGSGDRRPLNPDPDSAKPPTPAQVHWRSNFRALWHCQVHIASPRSPPSASAHPDNESTPFSTRFYGGLPAKVKIQEMRNKRLPPTSGKSKIFRLNCFAIRRAGPATPAKSRISRRFF